MAADLSPIHKLAWEKLNERMRPQPDGSAILALQDGTGGVVLSRRDMVDIGVYLEVETSAARRAAEWGLNFSIPFGLMMLALHAQVPWLKRLSDWIDATSSYLAIAYLLVLLMGMPLGLIIHHALVIRRAIKAVDLGLVARPRVAVPPLPVLTMNAVDKLFIFIAASDIVPSIIHVVSPDSLRDTPLVGSTFSPLTLGVLLVIAFRFRKRRQLVSPRARQLSQNPY